MSLARTMFVAAAVVGISLSSVALVSATTERVTTNTSREDWYSSSPLCEQIACGLLPAPPFPEHTLHVALSAGETSALTALELDRSLLPDSADIIGGRLLMPLDTDESDGSMNPETADLRVCLVLERFEGGAQGDFSEPPKYNCERASSRARYKAKPQPMFVVDLAAFGKVWRDGEIPRLVVVPAPKAAKAGESWHVVFWGRKNKSENALPMSATLKYVAPKKVAPPAPPPPAGQRQPAPPTGQAIPPISAGETFVPPPVAEAPGCEVARPQHVTQAPVASPAVRRFNYPYPVAWIMPLLLLAGFAISGHELTKPLQPKAALRPLLELRGANDVAG